MPPASAKISASWGTSRYFDPMYRNRGKVRARATASSQVTGQRTSSTAVMRPSSPSTVGALARPCRPVEHPPPTPPVANARLRGGQALSGREGERSRLGGARSADGWAAVSPGNGLLQSGGQGEQTLLPTQPRTQGDAERQDGTSVVGRGPVQRDGHGRCADDVPRAGPRGERALRPEVRLRVRVVAHLPDARWRLS